MHTVQALVHLYPAALALYVGLGNIPLVLEVKGHFEFCGFLRTPELPYGLVEKFHVHLEPDGEYFTMLLPSQHVARSPQLEVLQGNGKPGTESRVVVDDRQPFLRLLRNDPALRIEQVGVCLPFAPPHPPAELVELGEPEAVRALYDDGIDVRYIKTRFNDGSGHEHLELHFEKILHDLFELALLHLAVRPLNGYTRKDISQLLHLPVDGFDAVMDIVNLPPPLHLPLYRVHDDFRVVLHHIGFYGNALGGRGFYQAHVPNIRHGHVERARNRSGGHGDDINELSQLLEFFLVFDPETLFLVDYHEPQILEEDILLDKPVGSYYHVDEPLIQVPDDGALLCRRFEP